MKNTIKPKSHDNNFYRSNEFSRSSYVKNVLSNVDSLNHSSFQSLINHKLTDTQAGVSPLYKNLRSDDMNGQPDLIPQSGNDNMKRRQSVPFGKEWTNSNYTFSKNNSKLLPVADKVVNQLIKSYFNLSLLRKGRRSKRVEILFKRLSPNKLFVSKAEIKHTSDKMTVTTYIYNREDKFLSFKLKRLHVAPSGRHRRKTRLKKREKYHGKKDNNTYVPQLKPNRRKVYLDSYKPHSFDFPISLRKTGRFTSARLKRRKRKNDFLVKYRYIVSKSTRLLKRIKNSKNLLLKYLNWDIKNFRAYETKYYRAFLKKAYKDLVLGARYRKLSYFNNKKFRNWFLIGIKSLLSKIYKKTVELNIVNLKYLPLNNDNFMEAVSDKLRNRNNRLPRVLRKAMKMVSIPSINLHTQSTHLISQGLRAGSRIEIVDTKLNNNNIVSLPFFYGKDLESMKTKYLPHRSVTSNILKKRKYSVISGVRLEAAGRLSKRLTASRSVFKYKYKGSLRNIEPSYSNVSYALYRGYIKPNVRYTNLNSKTRNGAFGLKGWMSSY